MRVGNKSDFISQIVHLNWLWNEKGRKRGTGAGIYNFGGRERGRRTVVWELNVISCLGARGMCCWERGRVLATAGGVFECCVVLRGGFAINCYHVSLFWNFLFGTVVGILWMQPKTP